MVNFGMLRHNGVLLSSKEYKLKKIVEIYKNLLLAINLNMEYYYDNTVNIF